MKPKRSRLKKQGGFTLMEIMVVVLILGLIAGYAIPRYLASIRTAKLGQVTANYETARTETWSAFYAPGSTSVSVEATVVANTADLTNPFGGTAVIANNGTVAAGVVKVDGTTSGQVTVTAYDDSSTPVAIKTETITDPKS